MFLVVTIILDTPAGGASVALNSTVPVGWVDAQPAASTTATATRDTNPSHPLKFIAFSFPLFWRHQTHLYLLKYPISRDFPYQLLNELTLVPLKSYLNRYRPQLPL